MSSSNHLHCLLLGHKLQIVNATPSLRLAVQEDQVVNHLQIGVCFRFVYISNND